VFLFEACDNAAVRAHEAAEHLKKYSTITANIVLQRNGRAFSSLAMNRKAGDRDGGGRRARCTSHSFISQLEGAGHIPTIPVLKRALAVLDEELLIGIERPCQTRNPSARSRLFQVAAV